VRSDGSVGGYAFVNKKKIELLENEGVNISDGRIMVFDERRIQIY